MLIKIFSAKAYDIEYFTQSNAKFDYSISFTKDHISVTNINALEGVNVVCAFVNDRIDRPVLQAMQKKNIRLLALRCAGYNQVDLAAANELGITVVRVPKYSPYAVAEHSCGLILSLNRHIHRAYVRVREHDFSLDHLTGFDIHGKTVGIIGTGAIGSAFAQIMLGFGASILAYDVKPNIQLEAQGIKYVDLDTLYQQSDIISLHCPLTPDTHHLIDRTAIAKMKNQVMLINTSRGGLINTADVINALKAKHVGALGLDVYEEEADVFFEDLSDEIIADDQLTRLMAFPNVLITSHQAFLTHEALTNIADTTLQNIADFFAGNCQNVVQ